MIKYVIVEWPESQELMKHPDFNEHSCLINDENWLDQYGPMSSLLKKTD